MPFEYVPFIEGEPSIRMIYLAPLDMMRKAISIGSRCSGRQSFPFSACFGILPLNKTELALILRPRVFRFSATAGLASGITMLSIINRASRVRRASTFMADKILVAISS